MSVDSPAVTSVQSPESPRTSADPARARDPYYDNVRFFAVVLVVLGHAWYSLTESRLSDAAHLFVFTFHMPVFILVAGYFSRRFASTPAKVRRLVVGLGVPYLVFDAVYPAFGHVFHHDEFVWSPLSPYWVMWFLPALIVWRLSTPLWQQLRWPLAFAVLASVGSGAIQLPDEVATRVLGFLPFFVVGLQLREEHIAWLRTRAARIVAVGVTICAIVTAAFATGHMNEEWLSYRIGYHEMHVSPLVGMPMRLGTLTCGLVMTAAFMALVPRRRLRFTDMGGRSMYVYLLHGFFIFGATYAGGYRAVNKLGIVGGFAVVSAMGILVALLLASRPVKRALRWLVEPRLDWAFKQRSRRSQTAADGPHDDASPPGEADRVR